MPTNNPLAPFLFKRLSAETLDRAEAVVKATIGLAAPAIRINLSEGSLILTWRVGPGRTLVWYASDGDEWSPARVVQQAEPARSHWADVGGASDLVAILREELGIEEE
jgi:hypothetical protein